MRNSSRLTLLGAALLAGTSMLPIAALAETVETIVVTAEKRAEEAKNVPMSLTVVGQDQLNNLNIRSYEDLFAQVPGLQVSEADPTHPVLTLRGINAGGDGSTVGTYIDETPYGSSNALANGTDTAPNLDTFDMQRIEVLRGPQGTLYGAGAEGGLLKFVTNAPDTTDFDDAFEFGGLNMDQGGFGQSARAMFNVPLSDEAAIRFVGFDERLPGFIKNPVLGIDHANDGSKSGGRIAFLWRPSDKFSLRLNFMQQQLDVGNDSVEDVVVNNGKITPLFGDYTQMRNVLSPSQVRYYSYNATMNWDLDFATLTTSTSYTQLRSSEFTDGTAFASTLFNPLQAFLHQGRFIQEVRLASDPGSSPLDWMVGFYYADEHDGLHQDVVPTFHGSPLLSLDVDSTYVETTGFANATYHVTSNFELGAGLRYSHDNQDAVEIEQIQLLSIPPFDAVPPKPEEHNVLTWSGDARYHLDDNTMFYARVASGWRPGGPNIVPPSAPSSVPLTFNPDSLIDYELGVKSTLPNENLSFDADVYDIEWQDIQLLEEVAGTGVDGNGGRANSKGVEANVTWLPIDRLTLNLNGAFNDATLSNDAPGVGGVKGNALPGSPRWSGTLNGDYSFLPMGDFTPYVGASWHYVGIRGWGFNVDPTSPTGAAIPEGSIPSYNTVDLRVGVDWRSWSLELYGKNVNGAKGISTFAAFGTSGATLGAPNPLLSAPFTAANVSVIQPRVIGIVLRGKI